MQRRTATLIAVGLALSALVQSCGGAAPAGGGAGATSGGPAANEGAGASSTGAGTAAAKTTSQSASTSAVFDDPCALLTLADVQTVMADAQPGDIVGKEPNGGACSWRNQTPLGPEVTYRYQRVAGASAELRAAMERNLKAPGAKKADIGDGGTIGRSGRMLSVGFTKGDVVVELLYIGDAPPTEESMVALAKKAAARL